MKFTIIKDMILFIYSILFISNCIASMQFGNKAENRKNEYHEHRHHHCFYDYKISLETDFIHTYIQKKTFCKKLLIFLDNPEICNFTDLFDFTKRNNAYILTIKEQTLTCPFNGCGQTFNISHKEIDIEMDFAIKSSIFGAVSKFTDHITNYHNANYRMEPEGISWGNLILMDILTTRLVDRLKIAIER